MFHYLIELSFFLVWPRFPKSASTISYASAKQGSLRGDYVIAWKFEDLPENKDEYDTAVVSIHIRLLIPPTGKGVLRLPIPPSSSTSAIIRTAQVLPDLKSAELEANEICQERRKKKLGFHYNWDYDRNKKEWFKRLNGKAIGTPCESFMFHQLADKAKWTNERSITQNLQDRSDQTLSPGFYEVIIREWPLEKELVGDGPHGSRLGNIPSLYTANDVGPYCSDESEAEWKIEDGTHII